MLAKKPEVGLSAASAVAEASAIVAALVRPRRGKRPVFWRIRDGIPRGLELVLLLASAVAPLLIWTALRLSGSVSPIFLPGPMDVLTAGRDMLASGELVKDTIASTERVFAGFGLAVLISVPLGLAMGSFRSIRALF